MLLHICVWTDTHSRFLYLYSTCVPAVHSYLHHKNIYISYFHIYFILMLYFICSVYSFILYFKSILYSILSVDIWIQLVCSAVLTFYPFILAPQKYCQKYLYFIFHIDNIFYIFSLYFYSIFHINIIFYTFSWYLDSTCVLGRPDILCVHTCNTEIFSMRQLYHVILINFNMFLQKWEKLQI